MLDTCAAVGCFRVATTRVRSVCVHEHDLVDDLCAAHASWQYFSCRICEESIIHPHRCECYVHRTSVPT